MHRDNSDSETWMEYNLFFSFFLRKSKEEYDEEMSRRLLLDETVGSTSSSCSDKPMAESSKAQNAATAPSQQSSTAKVNGKSVTKGESKTDAAVGDTKSAAKRSSTSKATADCGSNGVESRVLPALRAPVKSGEPVGLSPAAEACLEEAHREAGFSKPYTELTSSQQEQLQQRAAYLRQQRDKLHALKKEQQKSKQAAAPEETPSTTTSTTTTVPEISAEERKKLQKRKHLADKLKEEVIKK